MMHSLFLPDFAPGFAPDFPMSLSSSADSPTRRDQRIRWLAQPHQCQLQPAFQESQYEFAHRRLHAPVPSRHLARSQQSHRNPAHTRALPARKAGAPQRSDFKQLQSLYLEPAKSALVDELSEETRIAKAVLLREAVDDLLVKYKKLKLPKR